MPSLTYIHGFLSSSKSKKAQQCKEWLYKYRPDIEFHCPDFSSYPDQAEQVLRAHLTQLDPSDSYLVGSSLGGFWSAHFVEQGLANRAVLINPAVSPHTRFTNLIGQKLEHYYSDEVVCLGSGDIETLAACETPICQVPDKLWLMVQTGDEVLDYRTATERYAASRQVVEEGGNHSFEGFEKWIPEILQFFER